MVSIPVTTTTKIELLGLGANKTKNARVGSHHLLVGGMDFFVVGIVSLEAVLAAKEVAQSQFFTLGTGQVGGNLIFATRRSACERRSGGGQDHGRNVDGALTSCSCRVVLYKTLCWWCAEERRRIRTIRFWVGGQTTLLVLTLLSRNLRNLQLWEATFCR